MKKEKMHNYDVVVGRNLLAEVAPKLSGARKVLIIHPEALTTSAETLKESLDQSGLEAILATIPNGDDSKRVEVAAFCWQIMGQADFNRNDAIIGFGGGTTTDMAGFVASTWLRGVKLVLVPTTLLAMVDAAIGGKTGINTAEGKNLVGTFYLPTAVIADIETLRTLPKNDLLAGFAEVVKYGFIIDPEILDIVEKDLDSVLDLDGDVLISLVQRSIDIKRSITEQDFQESGIREILNYGHTLGHAIEHVERYQWRHGAAISIGMVFAAELAFSTGKISETDLERHRSVLRSLGLPVSYRADRWDQLNAAMKRDKKARAGILRFVVLDRIGKASVMPSATDEQLFNAFQAIID